MIESDLSGVPEDVAAARSALEREIAGSTLLTVFAETAASAADVVAHRWLADGQWRSLTYREVRERVRDAALGLAEAGLGPGEFAAIWSGNRSEATIADYAVMHARGVPVFIYPTIAPEQAADLIGHCGATVVIIEPGFLPAFDAIRARLPRLRAIVVLDDAPAPGQRAAREAGQETGRPPAAGDTQVISWTDLLARGSAAAGRDAGAFDRSWRQVTPDSLATLIYTSGTTGRPKGVMLTHRNIRFAQESGLVVVPLAEQTDADGVARLVSYLPMAHITGRYVDHYASMSHPVTLAYCPDHNRLFEIATLVRPTALIGIPRVWEKLHAALRGALPDVSPDTVRSLPDDLKQAIRTRIGLDQTGFAASGAAPLDPEIIAFFRALGVPLTEGWGMSELCNAATLSAPADARVGTVGRALPGMEVRVAADGEVLVRGPLVMGGYYQEPDLTLAAIDAGGWLHTGDIGQLDPGGYLRIVDRKKELIITSGGKNISPALVEFELQRHPLIGQACAIGDRRSYVTALLVLDPDTATDWARGHGVPFDSAADLVASPEVLAEVERAVATANARLARPEQVRRFALLPAEWTTRSGELTPSMKRRRSVIIDRYAKEIEELYA